MNEKLYAKITRWILEYEYRLKLFNIINKSFTALAYIIYPVFLIKLMIDGDKRLWRVLLIPSISFMVVSLFRKKFNAPRPYEVIDIKPLIHKDTKGKSFPSRHVFSAFIIARTLYYISVPTGTFLMLIGIIIALARVIGGVHFPRDVIAGAIIGISCAIIGWNFFVFI